MASPRQVRFHATYDACAVPLSSSDVDALRAAERALAESFEAAEPTAWVDYYTDDAIFVAPGSEALEGREALLAAARQMALSSVEIVARSTLGEGDLAATLGSASWVNGPRGSEAAMSRVRFLVVWRREADGRWRIARELLNVTCSGTADGGSRACAWPYACSSSGARR